MGKFFLNIFKKISSEIKSTDIELKSKYTTKKIVFKKNLTIN